MRRSMIFSAALHLLVLVLALVGLPKLWDTAPKVDTPLVVDVVTIDKATKAEDTPKPKAAEKKKPEKKPPPAPPKAQPLADQLPPAPPEPKPAETAKAEAEKVPVIKPKKKPKKKKKEAKKKEKPKAAQPPRQIARVRPRRRPPPSREDFLKSVLRDVAPEERAERTEKDAPKEAPQPAAKTTPVRRAPLDAQATMTEIDAIRRQIEGCWSIPAGARDAENLVVSIRVWANPDGTVAKAEILDRARMGSDPFYRSAAESALRAVLNPRCSPLQFPPTKYDQFKVMVLNFNPKEATGS